MGVTAASGNIYSSIFYSSFFYSDLLRLSQQVRASIYQQYNCYCVMSYHESLSIQLSQITQKGFWNTGLNSSTDTKGMYSTSNGSHLRQSLQHELPPKYKQSRQTFVLPIPSSVFVAFQSSRIFRDQEQFKCRNRGDVFYWSGHSKSSLIILLLVKI